MKLTIDSTAPEVEREEAEVPGNPWPEVVYVIDEIEDEDDPEGAPGWFKHSGDHGMFWHQYPSRQAYEDALLGDMLILLGGQIYKANELS